MNTEIAKLPANYDRVAIIEFIDDKLLFDTSGEEYGPCSIPISLLEQKLKEHKEKMPPDEEIFTPVGRLTKAQGVIGCEVAEVGHIVYETSDKYFIIVSNIKTGDLHRINYYKKTLAPFIDFI